LRRDRLPSLVLMTDDERLPDPLAAASALPRGSMVVVRARQTKRRDELSRAVLKIAHRNGFAVLIASDPEMAARLGADGFHLPEARSREATYWRARFPSLMITTAAHSFRALMLVRALPIDAVFLSPIFATSSHPERATLTPLRANIIARAMSKPVYALGGIDTRNATLLAPDAFAGIAAIGALAV
jgi:thiamine-phosphate pyrophosphorylase